MSAAVMPEWMRTYLRIERALPDRVVRLFNLGWDGQGITIPIEGRLKRRNLRHYDPLTGAVDDGGRGKMVWIPRGDGSDDDPLPIFPSWRDARYADLVVEGEFDCMVAIANGFTAVSGTAGAATWLREWDDALAGRDLTVLYDHDEAGAKGALKAAEALTRPGSIVRIATWPADRPEGWDITDHFRAGGTPQELAEVIAAARVVMPNLHVGQLGAVAL